MIIKVKEVESGNYIEIDLTVRDYKNIVKGRYPSDVEMVNGKSYTISVGIVGDLKDLVD